MKVLGLIVEFNPLHNGHEYFIEEAKKLTNPDVVIAVVSTSFSMRGDIMAMDKFTKTKMMLDKGIDLVLELPYISATQSADYFAKNSVDILNSFGITDLVFGSELGRLDLFDTLLELTKHPSFEATLKKHLDLGHSYPVGNYEALKSLTHDLDVIQAYNKPNNILALQYIKSVRAANPAINIHTIPRIAAMYHDRVPTDSKIASATAIRQLMRNSKDYSSYINFDVEKYPLVNLNVASDNLLKLIRYQFTVCQDFSSFLGISEGIENRIIQQLDKASTLDELIDLVQTKRYTKNRVKRVLLNVLLRIESVYFDHPVYYLRVLGMNTVGKQYLNTLPKDIKKSIITTFKNTNHVLVDLEIKATKLFGIITENPNLFVKEYQIPIVKSEEK
jgi:predicted nucleotidyltransferase